MDQNCQKLEDLKKEKEELQLLLPKNIDLTNNQEDINRLDLKLAKKRFFTKLETTNYFSFNFSESSSTFFFVLQ